jgi:hypothetical protein
MSQRSCPRGSGLTVQRRSGCISPTWPAVQGKAHLALMDGKADATALRSLDEAVHGTAQMV